MEERWRDTWSLLDMVAPHDRLRELRLRYEEAHRHYHTLQHVLDCLEEASRCRELQTRPADVELALWYHDVVYDPRARDNEARSAEVAAAALRDLLPGDRVKLITAMILDTSHDRAPASRDGALVVDIDLSILGSDAERFEAYSAAIRREYSWVPWFLYRRRRARVLRSFLDRPWIYTTGRYRELYEGRARVNIEKALAAL